MATLDQRKRRIYGSRRWRVVRLQVLGRAGWRCEECGRAGRLEVHHLDPRWQSSGDPFDVARLRALCRACHFEIHGANCRNRTVEVKGAAEWQEWLRSGR